MLHIKADSSAHFLANLTETTAKEPFGSPGWPSPGRAKRDFRGAAGAAPALSQRGLPQSLCKDGLEMTCLHKLRLLLEAVRDQTKCVDLKQVNRVLERRAAYQI